MKIYEVKVTINLKKGITDPEGANTLKALHLLGFENVKEVRTLRTFDLIIEDKSKENVIENVEKMCQRLLTNPVIHSYEININQT